MADVDEDDTNTGEDDTGTEVAGDKSSSHQNSLIWAQSAIDEVDQLIDLCQTDLSLDAERQSGQSLADRHFTYSVLHQAKRLFIPQFVKTRPRAKASPTITIDEV